MPTVLLDMFNIKQKKHYRMIVKGTGVKGHKRLAAPARQKRFIQNNLWT